MARDRRSDAPMNARQRDAARVRVSPPCQDRGPGMILCQLPVHHVGAHRAEWKRNPYRDAITSLERPA